MKATGVIRRIDELGRIVIPKEIRKSLRIKEGESLEIYVDNDENIILKKYSAIKKMEDFAQDLTDSIHSFVKRNIFITDNDHIIAASGPLKKEYLGKEISEELSNRIKRREEMLEKHTKKIMIMDDKEEEGTYAVSPIIVGGDSVGLVLLFSSEEKVEDLDLSFVQIAAKFLENHLD